MLQEVSLLLCSYVEYSGVSTVMGFLGSGWHLSKQLHVIKRLHVCYTHARVSILIRGVLPYATVDGIPYVSVGYS